GVAGGGVLDQPIHSLPIEALAVALPESIRVPIGELQLGAAIHVRDLVLPPGVKVMADPDAIVVHITIPAAEPAAPVVAPEAGGAGPAGIGRTAMDEQE